MSNTQFDQVEKLIDERNQTPKKMIAFYTELYTGTLMIDDRFKLCVKIQLPAHKKQTPRHLQRPFT